MTESLVLFTGYAGIGLLVGPFLGVQVYRRSGQSDKKQAVYLVRTLVLLIHSLWLWRCMPETLEPERRRPFKGLFVNPFTLSSDSSQKPRCCPG